MLATLNSFRPALRAAPKCLLWISGRASRAGQVPSARQDGPSGPPGRTQGALCLAACFLLCAAAADLPASPPPAAYAERHFHQALRNWQQSPDDAKTAWEFARACYALAEGVDTDIRREELAKQGIEVCRRTIQSHPQLGPAHYYLALNLGQLARTKTLGALAIIREMEQVFLSAIRLDPTIDHAGPHRALGILYRDAPGWPVSIGSQKKAKTHLEKALTLSPHYPGNQLSYLDSLLKWGEKEAVQKRLTATQAILQSARSELTGERWASSWAEWDQKWKMIQGNSAPADSGQDGATE